MWALRLVGCLLAAAAPRTLARINATKSVVDGEVEDIVWASETGVHLRTDQGVAYTSTDRGASFAVFPGCPGPGCVEALKQLPDPFRHLTLFHGAHASWVLDPAGAIIQHLPRPLVHVVHHPRHADRLLALECRAPLFDMRQRCEIFVSLDGGRTLKLVAGDVWPGAGIGWALPEAKHYDENDIFFVQLSDGFGRALVRRNLATTTPKALVKGCAAYASKHEFLFAAKLKGDASELSVSGDNGESWAPVHLPNDDPQLRFTVVDANDHMLFVNIYHQEGSTWGTTYSSDMSGAWFTPSIRHNRRNFQGNVDFHRVKGLNGVFIANVIPGYAESVACQTCKGTGDCEGACEYQSRISSDQGHSWHPLQVPPDDPICGGRTTEECSLHLHGEATDDPRFSTIRSHDVSPGFVLAAGNTGRKLAVGDDAVDLFMSRNGGSTWRRIKHGRWLYGFSDHGGLIVLAAHETTAVVWYSLDEGQSWASHRFVNDTDGVLVKKIVYNPFHPTSRHILLSTMTAAQESRVYRLDFSGLDNVRTCQGLKDPNAPSSDYEWWTPKEEGEKCHLGRLLKYALRKEGVICWDETGTMRRVDVANCTCTADDYECDYGFAEFPESDGTPQCKLDSKVDLPAPECKGGKRRVTRGYVKMADNWCEGGLQLGVTSEPCGGPGFGNHLGSFFFFLVAMAVFAIFCINLRMLQAVAPSLFRPFTRWWDGGYMRARQEDPDVEADDFDVGDDPSLVPDQRTNGGAGSPTDADRELLSAHASGSIPHEESDPVASSSPAAPATAPGPRPSKARAPAVPSPSSPRSPTSPSADVPLMKGNRGDKAVSLFPASDDDDEPL